MVVANYKNGDNFWIEEMDTQTCHCIYDYLEANPEGTAEEYAREVVMYFNSTLRPGESKRFLIRAEEV